MTTIYTVSTHNYKYGVFALINSLRQLKIDNPIVVGTDMHLTELDGIDNITQFIFDVDWNGTNLKAYTILNNPSDFFIYFDADIILTDKRFITEVEKALNENKLVVPIEGIDSENEIRRTYWQSIYPSKTDKIIHSWYYNAGFFAGVMAQHKHILNDWIALNKQYLNLKEFLFFNKKLPMADQDTLNAILQTLPIESMVTIQMPDWYSVATPQHPFYPIGNFKPHAFLHCTGKNKPWAITNVPANAPNTYDDFWYQYLFINNHPVKSDFNLPYFQKQWFQRTVISRLIIKLKKIFT